MSDNSAPARIEASIQGWPSWLSDLTGGRDITRWQGWAIQRHTPALSAAQRQGILVLAADEQVIASWPCLIHDEAPAAPPPPQQPPAAVQTLAGSAKPATTSNALGNWRGGLMVLTERQLLIRGCQMVCVGEGPSLEGVEDCDDDD